MARCECVAGLGFAQLHAADYSAINKDHQTPVIAQAGEQSMALAVHCCLLSTPR
jgi:hypothetical protein